MFGQCQSLKSYSKVTRTTVTPGNLKSKTFFTNMRGLGKFPQYMFLGCGQVNMDIDSELVDNIQFDYLFHWPTQINSRIINESIYTGINLIGTIHNNVFGGVLNTDGENYITTFTVIDGPFKQSGSKIYCDLSTMGSMFTNIKGTILQAKNVLAGLKFTNSTIPINIFEGCTKLNNIEGFFANPEITNEGEVFDNKKEYYEFLEVLDYLRETITLILSYQVKDSRIVLLQMLKVYLRNLEYLE